MPEGPGIRDRQRRLLLAERQIEETQARLADARRMLDDLQARGLQTQATERMIALTQEALDSMIAYRDLLAAAVKRSEP